MTEEAPASPQSGRPQLSRSLKNRHIQMIALGGCLGTGLFYGSGEAIALAGPAILLSYLIGGAVIYCIMRMLGEMAAQEPVAGSFSYFAYRYWGEFAGFLSGWNYWFLYILIGIAELTVIGIYLDYWLAIPHWQAAFAVLAVITAINLAAVRFFGEFEFWFSCIKVLAVIGMIIFGLFLLLSGRGGPQAHISNLWAYGGFFPHGAAGMILGLTVVMFSFGGAELVGIAAAEADEPETTIPKALRRFMGRILLFYLGATAIIMALAPWNSGGQAGSPFVMIFAQMGIPAAADILNIVVIAAAVSVLNSGCYSNGRMLFGLAEQGNAPRLFARLNGRSVPYAAVLFSSLCIGLGLLLNYAAPASAFMRILAVATAAAIVTWGVIVLVHIKFRRAYARRAPAGELVFRSLFYPASNYLCLAFLSALFALMLLTGFGPGGLLTGLFGLKAPLITLPVPDISLSALIVPVWVGILYFGFQLKQHKKRGAMPAAGGRDGA